MSPKAACLRTLSAVQLRSSWGAARVAPPAATRRRQNSEFDPICLGPCPALASKRPIHQLLPGSSSLYFPWVLEGVESSDGPGFCSGAPATQLSSLPLHKKPTGPPFCTSCPSLPHLPA